MPEAVAKAAPSTPSDQASGLRRLFERAGPAWSLVLQPGARAGRAPAALAQRARVLRALCGPTLVVDAARTQIAVALGLSLRFDLDHVLAGDCDIASACVDAGDGLWVLPAARAVDAASGDERRGARFAEALESLAAPMRQVMVVLPAGQVALLRHLAPLAGVREALLPVVERRDASATVLSAVRQAMSDSEIDTFHLLFPGMGEAAAGRLLSGMAAIAQRHFGATLLAAGNVAPAQPAGSRVQRGTPSVESVA